MWSVNFHPQPAIVRVRIDPYEHAHGCRSQSDSGGNLYLNWRSNEKKKKVGKSSHKPVWHGFCGG